MCSGSALWPFIILWEISLLGLPMALSWPCPASEPQLVLLEFVLTDSYAWVDLGIFFNAKILELFLPVSGSCLPNVILKQRSGALLETLYSFTQSSLFNTFSTTPQLSITHFPFFSLPISIPLKSQIHEFLLPLTFSTPRTDITNSSWELYGIWVIFRVFQEVITKGTGLKSELKSKHSG